MNIDRLFFCLLVAFTFSFAAIADDLLDSVLSEKPAEASAALSAQEATKPKTPPAKPQADGRLLDAVLTAPAAEGSTIDAAISAPPAQAPATAIDVLEAEDASPNATAAPAAPKTVVGDDATSALPGFMTSLVDLKSSSSPGETTKKNSTFLMRGGVGTANDSSSDPDSSLTLNFDMEIRFRLWDSPFDLSFRGFALHLMEEGEGSYQETYYTYWYSWYSGLHSYRHTRTIYYDWEYNETRVGAEAMLLLVPWRGTVLEPFAGVGIREEHARWKYEGESSKEGEYSAGGNDSDSCFSYRIGLKINLGRAFLQGEYIEGGDIGHYDGTKELIGTLGVRLQSGLLLQLNVESFEFDSTNKGIAFGGGFGFDF